MFKVRSRRLATVLFAPLAALAAWALFRVAGVTFHVSVGNGRVGAGDVVVAASVAALVAWAVVRQLERRARHPRLWWPRIASTGFALSITGPVWLADGASSVALMALHLLTTVVIAVGFATTLPPRRRPSTRAVAAHDGAAALHEQG